MTASVDKAALILLKKYEEGHRKNTRWSQRAFAKRLGLSSGALSEIMQGKRLLSPQIKRKLAARLELSPLEQADFFEDELPPSMRLKNLEYYRLSTDQFHLISDWWHFAILNLIKTKGFKPLPSWIAQRLDLPLKTAQEAWDLLFRSGHLKKVGQKIVREYPRVETDREVMSLSVRKAHLEDTKLVEQSIRNVPLEWRDNTAVTLVMNKKDIAKAREMIRIFQDKLSDELESKAGEEVYKLTVALFPLTKIVESP